MNIRYQAIPTDIVRALQNGDPDAYGNVPERAVSDGSRIPCRHCLKLVAQGDEYLIVAHRPFSNLQPYSETGPIFLHSGFCERATPDAKLPDMLNSPAYLVRGYDAGERIIYGTGQVGAGIRHQHICGVAAGRRQGPLRARAICRKQLLPVPG